MEPKQTSLPPAAYVNFLRVGQDRAEFHLALGQLVQPGARTTRLGRSSPAALVQPGGSLDLTYR